ncbi:MAG: EboA domain-containing protein [Deltaproteobacteria bacterium]|nr:EboA domain-containing protein [Deltaproteobacteria bacterium]
MELIESLVGAVARRAPDAVDWLRAHLAYDPAQWAPAFSAAGRKLGRAAITEEDVRDLPIPWAVGAGVDECGRAALVASAIVALEPAAHVTFVRDLIRRGEVRERQAVLRVLTGLPDAGRFVDVAIDACRTNVQAVFEAIACDNAFPARYLPAEPFAHLVLKALFIGAPVSRIVDLQARVDDNLVRMVEAYASERRAAGRPVPDDAKLVRKS